MTEDKIEPLCQRLYNALQSDKENEVQAIALELLCGFLTDINRLAWFTQQIAERMERDQPTTGEPS